MKNKINLLLEFEKRYTGDVRDTMSICEAIANEYGLNVDYVADYVYVNRYEKEESLEPEFK